MENREEQEKKEGFGLTFDEQYQNLIELMNTSLTRKMKRRMIKKEDKWASVISKILFMKQNDKNYIQGAEI
jgi:hypothetical protein